MDISLPPQKKMEINIQMPEQVGSLFGEEDILIALLKRAFIDKFMGA